MKSLEEVIQQLDLQPHPEGGYFKEVYRSAGVVGPESLSASYQGERNYCTSIYFLLTSQNFSAFHRIRQDEIWHFYRGAPISLHTLSPKGIHTEITIGNDLANGHQLQYVVPGGYWLGAEVKEENAYALVGCTVAPGFDFQDFELAERAKLVELFPQHQELITQFTRV